MKGLPEGYKTPLGAEKDPNRGPWRRWQPRGFKEWLQGAGGGISTGGVGCVVQLYGPAPAHLICPQSKPLSPTGRHMVPLSSAPPPLLLPLPGTLTPPPPPPLIPCEPVLTPHSPGAPKANWASGLRHYLLRAGCRSWLLPCPSPSGAAGL